MHVPARQRVNSSVGGRLLAGGLEQWPTVASSGITLLNWAV